MAFDRDLTLKQGEKFLRQGRPDAALGEYTRLPDEWPGDWNTASPGGDLHVRAGGVDQAVLLALQVAAGDYHDVPTRIDRLARVKGGG